MAGGSRPAGRIAGFGARSSCEEPVTDPHALSDMADSRMTAPARMIQAYYWLTPAFLFASWRYGFDVRVPFLDEWPLARAAYYALMFACAGVVFWRADLTAVVGRAETTLSASVLIISTWSAYFTMIDDA